MTFTGGFGRTRKTRVGHVPRGPIKRRRFDPSGDRARHGDVNASRSDSTRTKKYTRCGNGCRRHFPFGHAFSSDARDDGPFFRHQAPFFFPIIYYQTVVASVSRVEFKTEPLTRARIAIKRYLKKKKKKKLSPLCFYTFIFAPVWAVVFEREEATNYRKRRCLSIPRSGSSSNERNTRVGKN